MAISFELSSRTDGSQQDTIGDRLYTEKELVPWRTQQRHQYVELRAATTRRQPQQGFPRVGDDVLASGQNATIWRLKRRRPVVIVVSRRLF